MLHFYQEQGRCFAGRTQNDTTRGKGIPKVVIHVVKQPREGIDNTVNSISMMIAPNTTSHGWANVVCGAPELLEQQVQTSDSRLKSLQTVGSSDFGEWSHPDFHCGTAGSRLWHSVSQSASHIAFVVKS